jgi:hypothetical protein
MKRFLHLPEQEDHQLIASPLIFALFLHSQIVASQAANQTAQSNIIANNPINSLFFNQQLEIETMSALFALCRRAAAL